MSSYTFQAMNPQKYPTIDMELDLYQQEQSQEDYFPSSNISDHFVHVNGSEADVPEDSLELLAQDIPEVVLSEYKEQIKYLAEKLPTHELSAACEEAYASPNPGSVFTEYMERIHDNPTLFETSVGNREGPVEIDLSNPAAGLLYFDFDPEA